MGFRKVPNRNLWINNKTNRAYSYSYSPRGIAHTPHVVASMLRGIISDVKYFKTKKEAFSYIRMRTKR